SRLLRMIGVVKVRAAAHSNELREFIIDDDGIHIGDMLTQFQGLLGGRPKRRTENDGDDFNHDVAND
ncbi:MAG: hypothetical protein ABIO59_03365, partial [Luteimonas sp.]